MSLTMTIQQIKDFVAREFSGASAEVHAFVSALESKDSQLAAAKTLLETNGFTVTPKA